MLTRSVSSHQCPMKANNTESAFRVVCCLAIGPGLSHMHSMVAVATEPY
jgi:hypothetical protein